MAACEQKCNKNVISDCISLDISHQMKILNMVIPIQMHFCSFVSNWCIASCKEPQVIQGNVTNYFQQYITECIVANFDVI